MYASRSRHFLLSVRTANHGILLRSPTSYVSPTGCGVSAQRHYNHQQREDEWEESKAVKVTVWWDFQRCRLPRRASPRHLSPRVTEALRCAGIRGPVEITAFGDVSHIPLTEQEALADTGVILSHVPSNPLPDDGGPAVVGVFKRSEDSAQSHIQEKCHKEGESEEPSPRPKKRTLQVEVPSSPPDESSRDNRKAPGSTQRPEPPSIHVEADVTRTVEVPSPPSDSPCMDQRNDVAVDPVMQTERPVNLMEADKANAAGGPSSSGGQGNISKKRGFLERISSLWNGQKD
uniref:NYN domain-containing protein n=1 Tax=Zea mays TaxID=4577 RepID=A0A804P1R6_MAIZE